MTETVIISRRFCGPPRSGNGGYVSGLVARAMTGTVAVRLHAPPPLDTELTLDRTDGHVWLREGDKGIAEGRPATLDITVPPVPAFTAVEVASGHFCGFHDHAFPGCFVCGPDRAEGDGLRIFPGPLDGKNHVAGPWVPDSSLAGEDGLIAPEFLWAALDCTGAYTILPLDGDKAVVLGELVATLVSPVKPGERCVASGWALEHHGRKYHVGSAIHGEDGRLAAFARALWIEVPKSAWA